jgi:hypothetical protein
MRVENNGDQDQSSKDIAALVAAYRKSGMGFRRFAQAHKIPPGRLHYWVYQKYRNVRSTPFTLGRHNDPAPVFQEVTLGHGSALMESWAAEVRLAGGVSVRFDRTAAPEWIGEVIGVLQRPC